VFGVTALINARARSVIYWFSNWLARLGRKV